MARTLILNVSGTSQTLPAGYGGGSVAPGYGWVVSDESSVAVAALGGFADMDGKWVVSAISTDTALGSLDVAANGVALIAQYAGGGGGGGGPVAWNDVTSKPTFSTVATSGSYTDLINKPALADVATSGDYADLTNKPTIPAAANTTPNATSTTGAAGVGATYARGDHQHAHGNLAGGALHSNATTIAAGFMSAEDKAALDSLVSDAAGGTGVFSAPPISLAGMTGDYNDLTNKPTLAAVATSGSYSDLSGKPSLFSGVYDDLTGKPSLFSGAYADLTGKPTLAAVATSGSAADLSNNPYDIIANASGSLTVGQVVLKAFAPRNLTLTALTQASTTTAVLEVKVDGVAASYPQAVTAGQLITAVVTVAGVDCWFSITGKVA